MIYIYKQAQLVTAHVYYCWLYGLGGAENHKQVQWRESKSWFHLYYILYVHQIFLTHSKIYLEVSEGNHLRIQMRD